MTRNDKKYVFVKVVSEKLLWAIDFRQREFNQSYRVSLNIPLAYITLLIIIGTISARY